MIDWNKPVQQRNGEPVVAMLEYRASNGEARRAVLVEDNGGGQVPSSRRANGQVDAYGGHPRDVINVPDKPDTLDLARPLQTRTGKPARLVSRYTDQCGEDRMLVLIKEDKGEVASSLPPTGLHSKRGDEYAQDIVNVPAVVPFAERPETLETIKVLGDVLTHEQLREISKAIMVTSGQPRTDDETRARSEVYLMVQKVLCKD